MTLYLNISSINRGPGYFKLNSSILLKPEFRQNIKDSVQETVTNNNGCNPNTMWELIKGTVRNESIKYSSQNKVENRKKKKNK